MQAWSQKMLVGLCQDPQNLLKILKRIFADLENNSFSVLMVLFKLLVESHY